MERFPATCPDKVGPESPRFSDHSEGTTRRVRNPGQVKVFDDSRWFWLGQPGVEPEAWQLKVPQTIRGSGRRIPVAKLTAESGVRESAPDAHNHEEAQAFREDKRREVRERRNLKPGEVLACADTFADVGDKFLAYQKPRLTPKAYEREAGIVAHLKTHFTGRLVDFGSSQVSDYVTARLSTEIRRGKKVIKGRMVSKSSVRKELQSLKHLFRLACTEWKMLPRFANPCLDVAAPKFRDERTQHLSPEQFKRVLIAAPDNMKPIFALLTARGMRRSELLGCRWECVDGTRILLPTSKNDEPKEVHLAVFAQKVVASIPQGEPDELLFPGVSPEAVSMAFNRTCKTLKIADIRLHDLRHTFATWLRQRGTDLNIIASQLGHRDLRMTKRYARIASAQVKQAVSGLDSVFLDAQEGEKPVVSHAQVTAKQLTEGENPASLSF